MTALTDALSTINLLGPSSRVVIWSVLAILLVVGALLGIRSNPKRTLYAALAAVVISLIAWFAMTIWPAPFPGEVPSILFVAAVVPIFLAILIFIGNRKVILTILTLVSILFAYLAANQVYRQFVTVASFLPPTNAVEMTYADFTATTSAPMKEGRPVGALVTVPLKGTTSGFDARDAVAYVPPAYWSHPEKRLPVLVLLAGNPGSPGLWFSAGEATTTLDDYQKENDGVAPIVISADGTGSLLGNPACVDGPEYKVQTYLAKDVPALMKDKFRVDPDQSHWTIGGLSYGGTCALTVAANHPQAYGTFLDFSGEAEPNAGTRDETVAQFFHGDEEAFTKINPVDIFERAKATGFTEFADLAGWFTSGTQEPATGKILHSQAELATSIGIETHVTTVPGGHTYQTWRAALAESIEFVAHRGGLT